MILVYDMGLLNPKDRAMISYKEYAQIVEGKRRDREHSEYLTRQICYYSIAPHQKRPLKPADLWKIGDEVDVNIERLNSDEFQEIRSNMQAACAANGVTLV